MHLLRDEAGFSVNGKEYLAKGVRWFSSTNQPRPDTVVAATRKLDSHDLLEKQPGGLAPRSWIQDFLNLCAIATGHKQDRLPIYQPRMAFNVGCTNLRV